MCKATAPSEQALCISCGDGVKNGDESDTDCGGVTWAKSAKSQCIAEPQYVGSQYLGCFADTSNRAVGPGQITRSDGANSVVSCAGLCAGSTYFGMQWSNECFCGNVLDNDTAIDVYGAAMEPDCNMACSGDAAQTCGGGWRNNVYRHGATDRRDNPIFGGGGFIGTMTLAACQAACAAPDTKDANGRPCVAVEWSSHSADPAAIAPCALAWGCTSTASWGGGGAYVMEQQCDLCADAAACNVAADYLSNQ